MFLDSYVQMFSSDSKYLENVGKCIPTFLASHCKALLSSDNLKKCMCGFPLLPNFNKRVPWTIYTNNVNMKKTRTMNRFCYPTSLVEELWSYVGFFHKCETTTLLSCTNSNNLMMMNKVNNMKPFKQSKGTIFLFYASYGFTLVSPS